jgi:hypothetical protein
VQHDHDNHSAAHRGGHRRACTRRWRGRAWNEFWNVVQDFVCEHTGPDSDIEAWRAAFDAGQVDYLTAQGWVSRWTTAPADYDCFGTTTAELCGDWRGKPLRRVLCHPHHAGYQAGRNGSGMHCTWSEDPRIEEREAATRAERWRAEDATRAAKRAEGLAWLAVATEVEIDDAKDRDEVESRGLTYKELGAELKRREAELAETARAAAWARCRAAFADGAILVDEGASATRGTYGVIPGRDAHVYFGVRVTTTWINVAEDAEVCDASGEYAGSLALVAEYIATGRYRVVDAGEVPPEPVVRRIGHERYRDIVRTEIAGKVAWVGRPRFASEPLILDAAGKIVRAKGARSAALDAYAAAGAP